MWPGQQCGDDEEYVSVGLGDNRSKNPECCRDVSKRIEQIYDLDTKDADSLQRPRQDRFQKVVVVIRKVTDKHNG